jgi:molybdopterin converting factor small subunit
MNDKAVIGITLLAFGPLAEELGWKRHHLTLENQDNIGQILQRLGLEQWKDKGLITALNSIHCDLDAELKDGDELALLPPVSGG